jgi:hypothetical protein
LGWPPAPHWTTISCLAPPTSASTAASLQIHFVWDSSKRKSTGSDHHPTYKRYYNLVCALSRSILGLPPAPHWTTISYLALLASASNGASDKKHLVLDSSKGKASGSNHPFTYKRYYNLVCALRRTNLGWPPAPLRTVISYLVAVIIHINNC